MRRFLATYMHALMLVLVATFILAYPQALAIGAPDRGVLATSVTHGLFFGSYLAGLLIAVASITRLGVWGSLRFVPVGADSSRQWLAFLWGGGVTILILLLTPFGSNPSDTAGLVMSWIVAAAFGAMAAEAGTFSRNALTILAIGCAVSVAAGMTALLLDAAWE